MANDGKGKSKEREPLELGGDTITLGGVALSMGGSGKGFSIGDGKGADCCDCPCEPCHGSELYDRFNTLDPEWEVVSILYSLAVAGGRLQAIQDTFNPIGPNETIIRRDYQGTIEKVIVECVVYEESPYTESAGIGFGTFTNQRFYFDLNIHWGLSDIVIRRGGTSVFIATVTASSHVLRIEIEDIGSGQVTSTFCVDNEEVGTYTDTYTFNSTEEYGMFASPAGSDEGVVVAEYDNFCLDIEPAPIAAIPTLTASPATPPVEITISVNELPAINATASIAGVSTSETEVTLAGAHVAATATPETPSVNVTVPITDQPSSTSTATDSSIAITLDASQATATATAGTADVETSSTSETTGLLATGTATSNSASVQVVLDGSQATATATANDGDTGTPGLLVTATATAESSDVQVQIDVSAPTTTASVDTDPTLELQVDANVATGAATANSADVETNATATPSGLPATATASADDPSVQVQLEGTAAASTSSANSSDVQATVDVAAPAATATADTGPDVEVAVDALAATATCGIDDADVGVRDIALPASATATANSADIELDIAVPAPITATSSTGTYSLEIEVSCDQAVATCSIDTAAVTLEGCAKDGCIYRCTASTWVEDTNNCEPGCICADEPADPCTEEREGDLEPVICVAE